MCIALNTYRSSTFQIKESGPKTRCHKKKCVLFQQNIGRQASKYMTIYEGVRLYRILEHLSVPCAHLLIACGPRQSFLCWEETSCVATCEHHLVHSQIQFSMGSCRKVEYESLPDNIKCWQEGIRELAFKSQPLGDRLLTQCSVWMKKKMPLGM